MQDARDAGDHCTNVPRGTLVFPNLLERFSLSHRIPDGLKFRHTRLAAVNCVLFPAAVTQRYLTGRELDWCVERRACSMGVGQKWQGPSVTKREQRWPRISCLRFA